MSKDSATLGIGESQLVVVLLLRRVLAAARDARSDGPALGVLRVRVLLDSSHCAIEGFLHSPPLFSSVGVPAAGMVVEVKVVVFQ